MSFPLFAKLHVNGADADPLYRFLKRSRPGFLGFEAVKWNFTKFLVARDGRVLRRYSPKRKPADLEEDIAAALAAPAPTVPGLGVPSG